MRFGSKDLTEYVIVGLRVLPRGRVQGKTGRDCVQQFASLSLMVKNYTAPLRLQGHGVVKVSSVSLTSLLTAIHKHDDISRLKVRSVKILLTVLSLQWLLGFPVLLLVLCSTFLLSVHSE